MSYPIDPLYLLGDKNIKDSCLRGVTIKDDSECEKACKQLGFTMANDKQKFNDFCFKDNSDQCYRDNEKLSINTEVQLICQKEGILYIRSCRDLTRIK